MRGIALACLLVACSKPAPLARVPTIEEWDRERFSSDPSAKEWVRLDVHDDTRDDTIEAVCVRVDGKTALLLVRANGAFQWLLYEGVFVRAGSRHVVGATAIASGKGRSDRKVLTTERVIEVSGADEHAIDARVADDRVTLTRGEIVQPPIARINRE